MSRLVGVGLVMVWTVALALCGLVRYLSSPLFSPHLAELLGERMGGAVRIGSAKLSGLGFEFSLVEVSSDTWQMTIEEARLCWGEVVIVRPTFRYKKFERVPSEISAPGRVAIRGLRIVVGEQELGPFNGQLGPEGLDVYCSSPVPIGVKGAVDDLYMTIGPMGLKGLLKGSGRFNMTLHRSRDGLKGAGELLLADLAFASWAGLSDFSGGLRVDAGPSVVLEQYGEARIGLAGTVARLRDARARWAGGAVEGTAAVDSEWGSARVEFAARFRRDSVTLERARVEGRLKLPAGGGRAAVFEGAAEGRAEFLPTETRAEMRLLGPVSFELRPKKGPPLLKLNLGGKVGLKLMGTGRRRALKGRVEGLTLGWKGKLSEERPVLSFDFSLRRNALEITNLVARGESGWEGKGQGKLEFAGAGRLEGAFEMRGMRLERLCKEKVRKLISPKAKVFRAVSARGPLGSLRVTVESGVESLDFRDKSTGFSLYGAEVEINDEAVIELRR